MGSAFSVLMRGSDCGARTAESSAACTTLRASDPSRRTGRRSPISGGINASAVSRRRDDLARGIVRNTELRRRCGSAPQRGTHGERLIRPDEGVEPCRLERGSKLIRGNAVQILPDVHSVQIVLGHHRIKPILAQLPNKEIGVRPVSKRPNLHGVA